MFWECFDHVFDWDRTLMCKAGTMIRIPRMRNAGRTSCQGPTAMRLLKIMLVQMCDFGLWSSFQLLDCQFGEGN
jgi:hypothetical protein